jgi:hypothetical protein
MEIRETGPMFNRTLTTNCPGIMVPTQHVKPTDAREGQHKSCPRRHFHPSVLFRPLHAFGAASSGEPSEVEPASSLGARNWPKT